MMIFIYVSLALFATLAGSITGMGGGVIMKPVMDLIGHYDSATIGVLSSATVLAMAVVSCLKQIGKKPKISLINIIVLGAASAGGGLLGQFLFDLCTKNLPSDNVVKIIQNAILCVIIVVIFLYMINKEKIKSPELKHWIFYILVGIMLGIMSSFLGIGGGPINVAILIYLFNLDVKTATFSSIVTILFAQISKLTTVAVTTGFAVFDLSVLPYMCIAGVVGAFVGGIINKRGSERVIVICFNAIQVLIMALCVVNIIRLAI